MAISGKATTKIDTSAYWRLCVLFVAQVSAVASITIFTAIGGLLFVRTGAPPAFAALPVLVIVLGGAIFAIFHPRLLKVVDEKTAMVIYLIVSVIGLFAVRFGADTLNKGTILIGCGLFSAQIAVAQTYRFIAMKQVPAERQPFAMAMIVFGALFGAALGSALITILGGGAARPSAEPLTVALAVTAATALLLGATPFQSKPAQSPGVSGTAGRVTTPPRVIGFYALGGISAASMNLVMLSGPLILHKIGASLDTIGTTMMLHMFGMYAPSLLVPSLFKRYSPSSILLGGASIGLIAAAAYAIPVGMFVRIGMILVGVSWNLLYISSGLLISKATGGSIEIQARFNVVVLTCTAIATACSTILLQLGGPQVVAAATFLVNGAAVIIVMAGRPSRKPGIA